MNELYLTSCFERGTIMHLSVECVVYIFKDRKSVFLNTFADSNSGFFTESYEGTSHWLERDWKRHVGICRWAVCTSAKKQLTVKARSLVWLVVSLYISQSPAASPTTNLQGKAWNKTWMVTTYIRNWCTSHRNVNRTQ